MENNERRDFLKSSLKMSLGVAALSTLNVIPAFAKDLAEENRQGFVFSQVKLPYAYAALEPHIDALTMEIHYTKHHAAYIKNVNEAIQADHLNFKDEYDFFSKASTLSPKARNNGGGAWNHNFFWESMQASGPVAPSGKLKAAIEKSFQSVDQFKEKFSQAALTRFGSGWAWLIHNNGVLSITSTANQDNPLMDNAIEKGTPLLALDVWEHAYYLKYQNKRNEYIASWWNIVDWNAVNKRFV
ncbi:superoxide dismutase [Pedobacter nutrimenti]|uniref:superoxide dismutase n=1 Tax=Pedobacter nutrimenti TaxID=1241337 RepID=UPI00292E64FB|nr:superoxide dismutase [Pedobacter nutrimenti]